ncbi:hypothetical protein CPC08DRAFT_765600, partial [Agrocybe pediades]
QRKLLEDAESNLFNCLASTRAAAQKYLDAVNLKEDQDSSAEEESEDSSFEEELKDFVEEVLLELPEDKESVEEAHAKISGYLDSDDDDESEDDAFYSEAETET